ncbi:MAG TPA: hypothetical protein VGL94_24610 [Ktedonobacteraceae bacterium]|jgi:hypothetical protein
MSDEGQAQSPAVVGQGVVANGEADHEAAENLGGVSALKNSRFMNPPTQVYDPEQQHDVVRTIITCSFILIFSLTILGSFVVVIWFNSNWASTKELVQLLLPAETALMGSAIGFYFGSQKAK